MDEQTRKALELAQEALMEVDDPKAWPFEIKQARRAAIAAIDAALSAPAAPVSEPRQKGIESMMLLADAYATACMEQGEAHDHVARDALIEALRAWAQPVSEPASPRAPLTYEQIEDEYCNCKTPALAPWLLFLAGARFAERKHGIGQEGGAA